MKYFMQVLLLLGGFLMATAWAEEDVRIMGTSAEGPFFDFYLGKDLSGHVRTRQPECDKCPEVTFKITSKVEAKLDGKLVPLKQFVLSSHQPSILHFDRQGKLKQIVWYTTTK